MDIRPERVGILGFSVGGHLAATAGTLWDRGNAAAKDPIERESSRPDALVVCYGVISLRVLAHRGSMENLLGPDASDDLVEELSADVQVTSDIRDAVGLQLAYGGRRAHQGTVAVCGGNLRHENLHDESNLHALAGTSSQASRAFQYHQIPAPISI